MTFGVKSEDHHEVFAAMREKLSRVVPEFELRYKAELVAEINQLKKRRSAVILGHNYMEPALYHTVPDITGDSLELCRRAAQTDADVILFCGVKFMAESAKILNPDKKVLLPSLKAGCSLAESIKPEDIRELRCKFPGVPVVAYVNTYADVKAEVDVCCTSSNAVRVVNALNGNAVIFLPDEYLARNVARESGKKIIFPESLTRSPDDSTMIGWHGKCEVHDRFTVSDVENVRRQFDDVVVLAHPECSPEVVAAADFSGSTTAMVGYVRESKGTRFVLLTECSMGDNIIAENPTKEIVRLCSIRCPHMNQITLEHTRDALLHMQYEIDVPVDVRNRARCSLERMLEVG